MKTCYYAHPMSIYDSHLEAHDLATINSMGFDCVNPNTPPYSNLSMREYCELAASCDVVAFRSDIDDKITSGVALELHAARKAGKPIVELIYLGRLKYRALTREETVARIMEKRRLEQAGRIDKLCVTDNEWDDQ